eukprot:SAG31_NODE_2670_length_5271_cov_4.007541_7_plen_198_part_01
MLSRSCCNPANRTYTPWPCSLLWHLPMSFLSRGFRQSGSRGSTIAKAGRRQRLTPLLDLSSAVFPSAGAMVVCRQQFQQTELRQLAAVAADCLQQWGNAEQLPPDEMLQACLQMLSSVLSWDFESCATLRSWKNMCESRANSSTPGSASMLHCPSLCAGFRPCRSLILLSLFSTARLSGRCAWKTAGYARVPGGENR